MNERGPSSTFRGGSEAPETYEAAPTPNLNLSEAEYLEMILDRAADQGWLAYHARPARVKGGRYVTAAQGNGARGFPDVIAARNGQLLIWEVKTQRGRLTAEQTAWLKATGGECIRLEDWRRVCRILDAPPRTVGGF